MYGSTQATGPTHAGLNIEQGLLTIIFYFICVCEIAALS